MPDPEDRRSADYVHSRELKARLDGIQTQISDIEGQLNRRILTQQRELSEQRNYFEAILTEKDKALEILAESINQALKSGDDHLREHISDQVRQVEAALTSSEKLLDTNLEKLRVEILAIEKESQMRHDSMQDQVTSRFEYSEQAVAKAEAANEKRFEDANQWRIQSSERERAQQEQTLRLTGTFLPREVADAQFEQMRRQIAELTEKLGKIA